MTASSLAPLAAALIMAGALAEAQAQRLPLTADLSLGAPIQAGNVTAWPVYSSRPAEPLSGAFLTLDLAQAQGLAVVRETNGAGPPAQPPPSNRDELPQQAIQMQQAVQMIQQRGEVDGRVNELVIENKGQRPILVLAGTLLKGGKQDRQVGQDFLVPGGQTVPVAAFCVEHGRWTATRDGQQTGGVFEAQKTLATKSVRSSGQYKDDQSAVWDNVAKENRKAGKAPGTGTLMATVADDDAAAKARREQVTHTLSAAFQGLRAAPPPPVGLAYAVEGKVREVRTFSHPALFDRLLETLLNTAAVEGDLAWREVTAAGRKPSTAPAEGKQVALLVGAARAAAAERSKNKAGNAVQTRKTAAVWASETYEDDAKAEPVTQSYMLAE